MLKNNLSQSLKEMYWQFLLEIREWHRAIIFEIPGKVGQCIRRIYTQKHFAACGKDLVLYPHIRIYNPQNFKAEKILFKPHTFFDFKTTRKIKVTS
jgi:hypothetical protein